jgi:hypothetical protein
VGELVGTAAADLAADVAKATDDMLTDPHASML